MIKVILREQLGIEGQETVIELGRMHEVQDIKTWKVIGLIVSSEDWLLDIALADTYKRHQIAASKDQNTSKWHAMDRGHQKGVAKDIPASRNDVDIGLLFWNNCIQPIKTRDVIPGNLKDP